VSGVDDLDRPSGFIDRQARIEYVRLAIAIFLTALTNQQAVLLAVIWEEAGFAHKDIGFLLAIYGIPLVVMSLFSGAVANRIGLLPTVRLGAVLTLTGLASLSLTYDSFFGSLASRLVQGIGFALFHAPIMTYGTTRITQERFVQLFGLLSAMAPLPYAFGPIVAEIFYHSFGARFFFLAGALPALIALPLLWTIRPGEKAQPPVGGLSGLILSPRIRLPILAAIVFGSMFGFITAYIAPVMLERGLSLGAFFAAFTLSIFSGRLGMLSLIENVDRRLVVAGGAVILAIGLLLAAFAYTTTAAAVAGIVFGLGHSIGFPVISAWLCDGTPPEQRATPLALFNATFFAAITFIALPASIAIGRFGYQPVMVVIALTGFLLATLMVAAWMRRFRIP
jgi:MFS family permease